MSISKTNPTVQKHKGVTIKLSLDTGRFHARDPLTGERWEESNVWAIRKKIDEPRWEPCDIRAYALAIDSDYEGMAEVYAKRKCFRTGKPDYIIRRLTRSKRYCDDSGQDISSFNYKRYVIVPFTKENGEKFERVKIISQEISDKIDELKNTVKQPHGNNLHGIE